MAGEELRATLEGGEAQLGQIQARDVARLIQGLEAAVAAAAYAALGRPRRTGTGRHTASVEAASRLVFRGVEAGSVVTVLALPVLARDDEDVLDIEVDDLAGAALDRLVGAAEQSSDHVDAGIARALADLADSLGIGERYDDLLVRSSRSTQVLRLDSAARLHFRRLADSPVAQQPDVLMGSLREADFDRYTARLRTASNETVVVSFPPELEDDVHEALRGQAQFEGEVTYDPATATAKRVHLRRVSSPVSLPFDMEAFWSSQSVAELASAQSVGPATLDGPLVELSDSEKRDILDAMAHLEA
jgi:hypothetical protein